MGESFLALLIEHRHNCIAIVVRIVKMPATFVLEAKEAMEHLQLLEPVLMHPMPDPYQVVVRRHPAAGSVARYSPQESPAATQWR